MSNPESITDAAKPVLFLLIPVFFFKKNPSFSWSLQLHLPQLSWRWSRYGNLTYSPIWERDIHLNMATSRYDQSIF